MRNKIPAFCIVLSMLFAMTAMPSNAAGDIKIVIDGKEIYSDQPPVIKNDRVFVPVRVIAENLGATVDFDDSNWTNKVIISDSNHTSEFEIGYAFCLIDGLELAMDTEPFIENSRTLLPVRIVSQALGCYVSWDGNTRTVNIQKSDYDESMYNDLKIYPDKPIVYEAIRDETEYAYPYGTFYDIYSVPALNINQDAAKALSEKINSVYQEYLNDNIANNETLFSDSCYAYYLYDGILSVIFYSTWDWWDVYDVFNYDIQSGKEITSEEILNRYNIDKDLLVNSVIERCLAHFEINCVEWKTVSYESYLTMKNSILKHSFNASSPIFIDNNGNIRALLLTYQDDDGQFTIDSGINVSDYK